MSRFVSLLKLGLTKKGLGQLSVMSVLVVMQVGGEAWYMDLINNMFRALFSRDSQLLYKSAALMVVQAIYATTVRPPQTPPHTHHTPHTHTHIHIHIYTVPRSGSRLCRADTGAAHLPDTTCRSRPSSSRLSANSR